MFTPPVKIKGAKNKKETSEKEEDSKTTKRYAVNVKRKSYKIPK